MTEQAKGFYEASKSLARNPLGIIALFIVLVYGLASLVIVFAASLSAEERVPLVYFLVLFPPLVLCVFSWLVSSHSGKLFAPSDFKDEENFIRSQMSVVASLTAAAVKWENTPSETQLQKIVEVVRTTGSAALSNGDHWRNHLLWVDDRPENNAYPRRAFESMGLRFTLALSTDQALESLSKYKFAAIISDMGRREGPREGYVLLDRLRKQEDRTPLFFFAGSNSSDHRRETFEHGGQGCTSDAEELFQMVMKAVVQRQLA